jgi:hypothetical protein
MRDWVAGRRLRRGVDLRPSKWSLERRRQARCPAIGSSPEQVVSGLLVVTESSASRPSSRC